jgi:hypothetical protein
MILCEIFQKVSKEQRFKSEEQGCLALYALICITPLMPCDRTTQNEDAMFNYTQRLLQNSFHYWLGK